MNDLYLNKKIIYLLKIKYLIKITKLIKFSNSIFLLSFSQQESHGDLKMDDIRKANFLIYEPLLFPLNLKMSVGREMHQMKNFASFNACKHGNQTLVVH